jgi:hypothetical protein
MDKHFEVWKVIFDGDGTMGENCGRKRHWKIVDKIIAGDGETAYKDVVNNLSVFGYFIVSAEYPVVTARLGKANPETYVVSPAGKEYRRADWDDTIAPKIAIRRVTPAAAVMNRPSIRVKRRVLKKKLGAAPRGFARVTSVPAT